MLTTSQESKTWQMTQCRVDFHPREPSRLYFGPEILTMPSSMERQVQTKIGGVIPHTSLGPEYSLDKAPLITIVSLLRSQDLATQLESPKREYYRRSGSGVLKLCLDFSTI